MTPGMSNPGGQDAADPPRRLMFNAINPADGKLVDVLIPAHRLQWAARMGKGAVLELDRCVREVLARPGAVFEGVRRDEDDDRGQTEGWLCYVGAPDVRYDLRSGVQRPRKDRVLLVFVNSERTVYTWRWEEEDATRPGLPADLEGRFKAQRL